MPGTRSRGSHRRLPRRISRCFQRLRRAGRIAPARALLAARGAGCRERPSDAERAATRRASGSPSSGQRRRDDGRSAPGDSEEARAERTKGKSGLMKEEREELARLRKENRILAEERDILKKAAGILSEPPPSGMPGSRR